MAKTEKPAATGSAPLWAVWAAVWKILLATIPEKGKTADAAPLITATTIPLTVTEGDTIQQEETPPGRSTALFEPAMQTLLIAIGFLFVFLGMGIIVCVITWNLQLVPIPPVNQQRSEIRSRSDTTPMPALPPTVPGVFFGPDLNHRNELSLIADTHPVVPDPNSLTTAGITKESTETIVAIDRVGEPTYDPTQKTWLLAGFCLTIGGLLSAMVGANGLAEPTGPTRDHVLYYRHLVLLGFALLIDGALNLLALAGFARSGVLTKVFAADSLRGADHAAAAILIMVSLCMASLGALFFFCNSIWQKVSDGPEKMEAFSAGEFWGGLWFRLGEAIIFTIVFLLVMLSINISSSLTTYSLPIIALLLGMFLKAGEALIYGIAQRLFDGFSALVQTQATGDTLVVYDYDTASAVSADLLAKLKSTSGVQSASFDPATNRLRLLIKGNSPSASDVVKTALVQGTGLALREIVQ